MVMIVERVFPFQGIIIHLLATTVVKEQLVQDYYVEIMVWRLLQKTVTCVAVAVAVLPPLLPPPPRPQTLEVAPGCRHQCRRRRRRHHHLNSSGRRQ